MSAHVLLNLLNELRKRDTMREMWSISSLFCSEVDKFNNTGARMLDSILSYDIKITLKSHFRRKNVIILSLCTQRCCGRHDVFQKSVKYCSGLSILLHGVTVSQTRLHMIKMRDRARVFAART